MARAYPRKCRALVISPWLEAWFLPSLFAEADICCDVVSVNPIFCLSSNVNCFQQVGAACELAPAALQLVEENGPYCMVVPSSDPLLGELAQRSLLHSAYRQLLPLFGHATTSHFYSKIGLSRVLTAAGIPTPPWRAASGAADALRQAQELAWPLFLKQDGSAGGQGTRCYSDWDSLECGVQRQVHWPCLLQQGVQGQLYSVEVLYWHGRLLAFACSRVLECMASYGPSLRRVYGRCVNSVVDLPAHLQRLGRALSLHGFANISLIHDGAGGDPMFFECDVRVNAWFHLDWELGGDFAYALRFRDQLGIHVCYQQFERRSLQPFLSRSSARVERHWPYRPPNDAPAFLDAVLHSGQLDRYV